MLLPRFLTSSPGPEVEGFEDDAEWTAVNGAVSDDTANKHTGTQSVKLTTDAGAAANQ